jgi:hypothetical protein
MKKSILSLLTLITALALLGCDHSMNNIEPPAGSQISITSPSEDAIVDGNVVIAVDVSGLSKVTKLELFMNGSLAQARTSPPWQFDWNTSALPANSFYTLTTKAYTYGAGYSTSQPVTVRTK